MKSRKTATVSSKPVIDDIAGVGKALDISKAPRNNRRLVLPPTTLYKYNTLDNFANRAIKVIHRHLKNLKSARYIPAKHLCLRTALKISQ